MPADGIQLRDKSHFMTSNEVFQIAQSFVDLGVTKIRLTGGEPLVRKEFPEILKNLAQLPVELSLTTNGILLDKYLDNIIQAGITSINISLDTLKKERFSTLTRRNEFKQVINNIDLAISSGLNVKINVVLIKGTNDDEILDFIEMTRESNVAVRFIEFMPFDGNNWSFDQKVSEKEILTTVETYFPSSKIQKLSDGGNFISRNYKISDYKGSFGIISTVTNPFCDSCNRIRLTADGKVKNCLFSNAETDILSTYRNGEDFQNQIAQIIDKKSKVRAGINLMDDDHVKDHKNRSMISIGG